MSRESELYKDKIEVSLDGRQIFYLFFGGAVIVGMVFVLGVMVGRRVEARGHVDAPRAAATVDPLAALDRLEGGGGLTAFQGGLRGADTPAAPAPDVDKTLKKKAEPKKDDKKEEKKKEDKKAEKPEDKKAEDKKPEDKKPEDKKPEDKKEAKAEKPEDKKPDDKKVAKADDKKPEDKKGKFTLQLSSFQDKAEAQAYLDSIKTNGYQAYLAEGEVDGKQYFRVRLGSYKSMDAANDAKADFEKSVKKSAIVTKL